MIEFSSSETKRNERSSKFFSSLLFSSCTINCKSSFERWEQSDQTTQCNLINRVFLLSALQFSRGFFRSFYFYFHFRESLFRLASVCLHLSVTTNAFLPVFSLSVTASLFLSLKNPKQKVLKWRGHVCVSLFPMWLTHPYTSTPRYASK